ncbi:MAG: SDR family oxidoreductase [Chitinophagia bacterium]|nr:SDR family oxidoreductase [Chitinophagia bacterium]
MKILLTGANGLLGQKIVSRLSDRPNIEFLATDLGDNLNPWSDTYLYVSLDLTHTSAVEKVVRDFKPEVIIHGAAMTQVDVCEQQPEVCRKVNVEATATLCRLCEELKARMIFVSTDFIFDGTEGPYKEEDVPNPLSIYGHSKWEAEKVVQATPISWAIVRTVLLYGTVPGLARTNIVLWVKSSLEQKKPIKVVNDQERTPTLAEDLADGILLIVMKNRQGIFHISGAESFRIIDLAREVAQFWKLDTSLIEETDSSVIAQPAKRPPRTGFIILRAQTELGYKPHSLRSGLELVDRQLKEDQK